MQDLNGKVTTNPLTASEWNEPMSEIQNVIQSITPALDGGNLEQLVKAIASIAAGGHYFIDTGATTQLFTLNPTSPQIGPSKLVDKMKVQFLAHASNTAAEPVASLPSIDVGFTSGQIKFSDGTSLVAGDIQANELITLEYNTANTRWNLVSNTFGTSLDRPLVVATSDAGSNVTGDDTAYRIVWTTSKDTHSQLSSNVFFKAKSKGLFMVTGSILLTVAQIDHDLMSITTVVNSGTPVIRNQSAVTETLVVNSLVISFLVELENDDEMEIFLTVDGSAKTVPIGVGPLVIAQL